MSTAELRRPIQRGELFRTLSFIAAAVGDLHAQADQLTQRDPDILRSLARAWTNREIGSALHLSSETVRNRVGRLLVRLGATDRSCPSHADEAGLSVLLIEDDPSVRSLLVFVLVRDGWRVETAASGAAGIRRLEQALPDIILLDLSMPDMDGWAVLARRAAESVWSRVPVVAMSAEHRHREMVLELGATAFLPKPFTLDELRETLRPLVQGP